MKPRILIVDDDSDLRTMLKIALEPTYQTFEAEDGMEGISEVLLSDEKIDLIIVDLKMPGMDGIEFVQNLPEKVPFIIISGFLYDNAYKETLKSLNPVAVFMKPFPLAKLQEAVASGIEAQEEPAL